MKLEITQDKISDVLLHVATREGIARLDQKVDAQLTKLDNKIDAKIDALRTEIKHDMRWVIGTKVTIGLVLAGLLFSMLHK